jgi:sulfite reductase (ferredoxin)
VGGQAQGSETQFGLLLGKFPAKNCLKVTETLLTYFEAEKNPDESFNTFVRRVGIPKLREITESLQHVPAFQDDPTFFEDYGHEHERFAVRRGIKGECAGSTVAERIPVIETARDWLAQAAAYIYHKEYSHAVIAAYEAAAAAARVPIYQRLVDPFTSEEALWEFENLLVLTGDTQGQWESISTNFERLRASGLETPGEESAREILNEASGFVDYTSGLELKVARNVA